MLFTATLGPAGMFPKRCHLHCFGEQINSSASRWYPRCKMLKEKITKVTMILEV